MAKSAKTRKLIVYGQKEIIKALQDIGDEAEKVLYEAVKEGANIVYDEAKSSNEFKDDSGDLRESIEIVEGKKKPKRAMWKVQINLKKAFYGAFVEFGTKKHKKQPFLRKSLDKNKKSVADRIIEAIKKRLERMK